MKKRYFKEEEWIRERGKEGKREREASTSDTQPAQIKAWGTEEEVDTIDGKRKQIEKQIQWTFDDGIKNWKANRYRKKKEKSN